jgi:WhiB family redox-sensing transcriptional regulator
MADLCRLPGPIADVYDWQAAGSCRKADPTLFFHPESEQAAERRKRDDAARAVCGECPVLEVCRAHGLAVGEAYGVWGGLSEDDRAELLARGPASGRSSFSAPSIRSVPGAESPRS